MKLRADNEKIIHTNSGGIDIFDMGNMLRNTPAIVQVNVEGENLSNITIKSSCSCTSANAQLIDSSKALFNIQYKNTHIAKAFGATTITWSLFEGCENKTGRIKIKGNIL